MFNLEEFEKIKKKALENHIPIIMDDTLEVIKKVLEEEKPKRILEIGTAVGYSASCFARYTSEEVCPILPTKLRLVVATALSPSASIPICPPRQGPQVGVLTTAPADTNVSKSPSFKACKYTA